MRNLISASLAIVVLASCAVISAETIDATTPIHATTRPPAPRIEVRPASPGEAFAWAAGYWRWDGNDYTWVDGNWIMKPQPLSTWVPGHWSHTDGGWIWIAGHWKHTRNA